MASANTRTALPVTGWVPSKYRWERMPANVWNAAINLIVLRMADIYLLYAEASNEATGDPNNTTLGMSAYAAINMVRTRAQVPIMACQVFVDYPPFVAESK